MGNVPWRIVYKPLPPADGGRQPIIHIVAIGPRAGLEVYETAARRLGRLADDPLPRNAEPRPAPKADSARTAAARSKSVTPSPEPTKTTGQSAPDKGLRPPAPRQRGRRTR
jgi:hypothetical protein